MLLSHIKHSFQKRIGQVLLGLFFLMLPSPGFASSMDLYTKHCAECHGIQRYGGTAPPLLPQFLRRKKDPQLHKLIEIGLPSTQMPAFAAKLKGDEISQIVKLLRTPVPDVTWGIEKIQASRKLEDVQPKTPIKFDRENTVLVVERGTGSVAVFDGNTMEQLDKYPVGRIHGGTKFDQTYQTVYAITRDGWLSWYDLENQQLMGKVQVSVNARNVAISPDSQVIAVANQLPQNVVFLDHTLQPLKLLPLKGKPSAVYQLPGEKKFVLTLRNLPQMLIVDYSSGFAVETVTLPEPFEDFMFVPGKQQIIASLRKGKQILLYDFTQKQVLATLATKALPHLFSAAFYEQNGTFYAALNHIGLPQLSIIDMETFKVVREIPLKGSGYFVRTHPNSSTIWVDTNTEFIQVIDKKTLTPISEIQPEAGKKAMHIEFTADGKKALVSVWHYDGAVVVYDAENMTEEKRIPFNMPIGKYNAYNKTRAFF